MIDVVEQISSVTRTVGSRDLGAGETRTVIISRSYDTDIEDLWDACTNAERIPRWFLPVSGDLGVGGRYQLTGNAEGTIETCNPPNGFAITWEFGGGVSWVEVRLVPESDQRTRFELAHTVPVDDHWARFGPGATGIGWDLGLMGLGIHLASGTAVDADAAEAWSASDEGKRFMALSSEGWHDAALAAGTTPEVARAAADRATSAFTGVGEEPVTS